MSFLVWTAFYWWITFLFLLCWCLTPCVFHMVAGTPKIAMDLWRSPMFRWRTQESTAVRSALNSTQTAPPAQSPYRVSLSLPPRHNKIQCCFTFNCSEAHSCVGCFSDIPGPPHTLELSEKMDRSVTLSWMPGAENNSPISGNFNQWLIQNSPLLTPFCVLLYLFNLDKL